MTENSKRERELQDDYPIFPGYLYVADGNVVRYMGVDATTAGRLRASDGIGSLTNCDIAARDLWEEMI